MFGLFGVSPEGTFDRTQVEHTEPSVRTCFCPSAGCSCISHTLPPTCFRLGEPQHPPRKPSDTKSQNWVTIERWGKRWIHRRAYVVWQAGHFRAAAVVSAGGCDETSSAGLGGVLTVTHTFKHIAALCLFHRQQAVCRAIRESLAGTLFFFAD